jgi:hypothetical protein
MSLIFPYKPLRTPRPIWSLGGRRERPTPLVTVSVIGPFGTSVERARLDTAADDTVFPEPVAAAIGIDLTGAPTGEATAVSGAKIPVLYAQVTLRLTDGREYREWPAPVAFAAIPRLQSLLGFAGCLQFFDALFRGAREEVELTVNPLYPGT